MNAPAGGDEFKIFVPLRFGDLSGDVHRIRPSFSVVQAFDILQIVDLTFAVEVHIIKEHKDGVGDPVNDHGGVRGRLPVGIVYDPLDGGPAFAVVGTSSDDQIDVFVVP